MTIEAQETSIRLDAPITPLGVLLRIGAIVAVVEALIMVGFSFFTGLPRIIENEHGLIAGIIDAAILTIFSSPLIYYWVIKPYVRARNAAEDALATSKARYRNILDSTNDAIISIDDDGRLVSCNLAAARMFGYSAFELCGLPLTDLLPNVNFEAMKAAMSETGSNAKLFELGVRRKDTAELATEVSISDWASGGRTFFTAVIRDVTAARKMMAHLQEVQRLEAVGQLTGGIAHEFNNLLTVVTGNLSLIRRQCQGDEQILQRIDNAQRAAKLGAQLTRQLLTFGRGQRLEFDALDLNAAVTEIAVMLNPTLGEQIRLKTTLEANSDLTHVDQDQLEQTIVNLALNAKDAMPGGGTLTIATADVVLDKAVALSFEMEPGLCTVLTVADTGTGMSWETRSKAFEPFFTTKDIGKGTGLGLSTAFGFVKQSGGHILAESEEGCGTTIRLYLPKAKASECSPVEAETPVSGLEDAGGRKTILVVEDQAEVRAIAVAMLGDLGYRVIESENGPNALIKLDRHRDVDLLFTDVIMPGGMTGPDLAARARERTPGLKVLFATGYGGGAPAQNGSLPDGAKIVAKPYEEAELARKIRESLGAQR